ncbi:hypothetical protein Pla123a_38910 [Posidoniimonas polymericola]|uniref:Uncharacterized protein n=1 Tax=Posidoniimonas polymericola TaxID=2528002 RepID=A0A5C5YGM2_9BACT|nr:hypothetical protein [Posidoniimonas polymericola]TWT73555.1 hypothetical protein Pla123a_38910 [Posidoniimonas polymericola]
MDQVKVALEWLKRHHFWVLILLAIIVASVAWQMGSSQLQTEIAANTSAIESKISAAKGIQNKPFHPNPDVNKVQSRENAALAAKVRTAWEALYDRQAREVLQWPSELRADFVKELSKLNFGDEILPIMRDRYLNYAQRTFPNLPKIVKAIELPADGGRGGRGGFGGGRGGEFGGGMGGEFGGRGGGGPALPEDLVGRDFLVQWHDQAEVREQLNWDKRPSSIAIWVTQEDLWVYETLLRAIANTNEAARSDRYSNAAVRDIFAMQVGSKANRSATTGGRIFVPQETTAGRGGEFGGMGGEFGGMGGGEFGAMGGGEFGGGRGGEFGGMGGEFGGMGGEGVDEKTMLLANRYVDAEGTAMTAPTEGEFKYGTEYKRLPVRLVLRLDQRWLNHLMIELANAPLQVEVQEVRINPQSDADFGGGGGRSRGRGGFGGGGMGGNSEVMAFNREPNVRDQVVIEGLVYIFYPPDENVLAVPTTGDELASDI